MVGRSRSAGAVLLLLLATLRGIHSFVSAGSEDGAALVISSVPATAKDWRQDGDDGRHHRWKRRVRPRTEEAAEKEDKEEADVEEKREERRKYKRLEHAIKIRGEIRSRYALTMVENTVENSEPEAREVFFSVILPETAFISRFAMEVGGEIYLSEVREKELAWKLYKTAVEEGKTAGHVGLTARHSNRFRVSVNTEAGSTVKFYLVYEELLQRKGGIYTYTLNISPHQKLTAYSIDINIIEQNKIVRLNLPELQRADIGGEEEKEMKNDGDSAHSALKGADVVVSPSDPGRARVTYNPEIHWLRDLGKETPLQFLLEYDVEREKGGEVDLYQGYFVHFVAPDELPPMPKHVVFVLDTSGSMRHRKMQQTVNAMKTILTEMRDQDYITIIRFSSEETVWDLRDNAIVAASPANRQQAVDYVETLEASGETNINSALVKALTIVAHVQQKGVLEGVQSMIFFLTDGHPTRGVTDTEAILKNVREANRHTRAAIFSLAFGIKTDFNMLKTLSLQNYGFARKIYTAADASLQLEGLYKEVSSPILSDVKFNYLNSDLLMESVTETVFHSYYQGGEMVVAGRLSRSTIDPERENEGTGASLIEYEITALQAHGEYRLIGNHEVEEVMPLSETVDNYIDFLPSVRLEYNFLERLWAYLTLQNLFVKLARGELVSCQQPPQQHHQEGSPEGPGEGLVLCNNLERALYLSLKYQFVTPLTSLVVVKPDRRENGDIGEADMFKKLDLMNLSSRMVASSHLVLILLILGAGLS